MNKYKKKTFLTFNIKKLETFFKSLSNVFNYLYRNGSYEVVFNLYEKLEIRLVMVTIKIITDSYYLVERMTTSQFK